MAVLGDAVRGRLGRLLGRPSGTPQPQLAAVDRHTVGESHGQDVSLAVVKAGLAWHYREYSRDKALADAELSARTAKQGLWSAPDPTPPWDYRREQVGR